jgi:hypothetical protein
MQHNVAYSYGHGVVLCANRHGKSSERVGMSLPFLAAKRHFRGGNGAIAGTLHAQSRDLNCDAYAVVA